MNALLSLSTPEIGAMPSLAAAFEARAQVRGEAAAVRCGKEEVSYAELHRLAGSVAQTLLERGVTRGSLVAIYLPRGIGMIAAMLGVCKAGAAYLPLDTTFPIARVLETLADAKPALLITDGDLLRALPEGIGAGTMLLADALTATRPANGAREAGASAGPDDLAYVIYTSGSTGKPKE